MTNGISVIICCYNSVQRLEKTLSHLQKQQISKSINWEIILVDNVSTDGTSTFANEIWKKKPVTTLRIAHESLPGQMHARKKGILSARYSVVTFIDDDNWVEPLWIEKVDDFFSKNPDITACGGFSEAVIDSNKPYWFDLISSIYAVGHQLPKSGLILKANECLWGAGLSIRTEIIRKLFEETYDFLNKGRTGTQLNSGDDSEICLILRLKGYKFWYKDDLKLKHEISASRLSMTYARKIMGSMGQSEVTLSIYRHTLDPNYKIYRSVLLEFTSQMKYIPKLLIQRIFASKNQRFISYMHLIFRLNYIKELLAKRNIRKTLFKRIHKLKE